MKRLTFPIILGAFIAALLGTLVGRAVFHGPIEPVAGLHKLLYDELDLSPEQYAKLKQLEHEYVLRKTALEQEMRGENAELARAIEVEHGYGPRVEAAIDRSHHTMGRLQKITLEHIFAMRGALTPEQAKRYDQVVTELLVQREQ